MLQPYVWQAPDRAGSDQRGGGHLHDAASEKLLSQKSYCKKVRVSIRTGMFNPDETKYAKGVLVTLPYPTDDVRLLTKAAVDALDHVFQQGFR